MFCGKGPRVTGEAPQRGLSGKNTGCISEQVWDTSDLRKACCVGVSVNVSVCVCVTAAGGRAEVLHILIGVKGLWVGINVASFEFTGF